jgi:hypothetical protein
MVLLTGAGKSFMLSVFFRFFLCVYNLNVLQFVIQAICDHRGIFTDYELGWPGSVANSTIFKESEMWLKRHEYFAEGEYILVDKGVFVILGLFFSDIDARVSVDQIFDLPLQ